MSIVRGGVLKARPGSPQEHLLECPYDDILYAGGRGGGKSWGVILKIKQHHDLYGADASIIVLRRTFKELQHFIKIARRLLPNDGWRYKVGEKKFVHKETGCEIVLMHLDDEDASDLQGHEYTLVIIEEAGNFETSEAIDQLWGTMRSGAGVHCQIILTANPGGIGNDWLRARYVEAGGAFVPMPFGDDNEFTRYYVHATALDNPDLMEADPFYLSKLKQTGPPQLIKAWVTGDWDAAPQGPVFKREYFTNTYSIGAIPNFIRIIQCWDTGYKTGKNNDRSACTTWGVTKNAVFLLHAWAGKVEFPELKEQAKRLYGAWRPHVVYVEDKASGQSLIQELKRDTLIPIRPCSTDTDKLARAYAVTPMFEAGRVFVPREPNDWLLGYVEELCSFPKGKHDDYVDSTSHGLGRIIHFANSLENRDRKVVPFNASVWSV